MIINRLTLHNFRQFYGTQTLEFGNQSNNQLVTIILGENGRGKTGVYRAILFALYGDLLLEQDSSDSEVILTNIKALQEDYNNEHKGVVCKVSLDFHHEREHFLIERSIYSIMENNEKVIERLKDVKLYHYEQEKMIHDEDQINQMINKMLDARVKNYFFFDGERIERLTRASLQQRNEIATGIKNLLKIDHLLKTKDVLVHVQKQVTKELQKHSTGEYQKKLKEKLRLDEELEKNRKEKSQLFQQLSSVEASIISIDEKLNMFQEKIDEIGKRKELENRYEKVQQEYEYAFQRLQEFNSTLQLMLSKDSLYAVKSQIDILLGEESEKSFVSLELIEQILRDFTCICGTTFTEGSKEYDALKGLQRAVEYKLEKADYLELKANIMRLIGFLEDKDKHLQYLLESVNQKEQELEEIRSQIEYINQQLKDTKIEDLDQINAQRERLVQQKIEIGVQIRQLDEDYETLQAKREQSNLALRDLKVKSGVHQQLIRKQEEVTKAIKVIDELIQQFEKDVISDLEITSTQNLHYILDDSGRMNIKQVKVLPDYSLEVVNHFGQPFLANISQGQRQVLSLSFITALAQVAGGTETLEMPLFMDTPFGRLSGKHQMNLLSFIPKVCSQWILLVTDKEFGENEKRCFLKQGQVGKFYVLESVEPGVTQIIERSLEMTNVTM
ncbi:MULTISPECIES: AAA family ATPase [Bacillota]|uniref:Nuclease SbcCD subunit C n=1 Tax=Symbiobacterium thermophilum TaxID=2734 RepID=A0A953LHF4_SYMTR|nr:MULTISPECIES: AAA family ATPase [Bacillota]MBY6277208.1 DNA sulfur modification protein DndD [Symbiobacterium thermophilum]MED4903609.1 AAA family ATPase [Parageobacillus thermoglucosidasius]MED4913182.1 AAA family ATPase [Parageobacillus thermoglucosidasius]MED4944750.1 AAA family ATPase [Parageobacillus thermoglucosidasius]MED4984657.1 AAA family ATPase [Parageobacillus thermoglucosidasius]